MTEPDDIVRAKKKGFRVARSKHKKSSLAESDSPVVAKSPSLEELKAKYLPPDHDQEMAGPHPPQWNALVVVSMRS